MVTKRKNQVLTLLKPLSFLGSVCLIWTLFVFLPRFALDLYQYLVTDGGMSGTMSIYFLPASYYVASLSFGFQIAVTVKILQIGRRHIFRLQGIIIPPYSPYLSNPLPLPHSPDEFQYNIRRSLLTGLFIFGLTFLLLLAPFKTTFANIQSVGDNLELWGEQYEYVFRIIHPLLEFTPQNVISIDTSELDSLSLAANLLYLWLPSFTLSIGFLNMLSVIYNPVFDGLSFITSYVIHTISEC